MKFITQLVERFLVLLFIFCVANCSPPKASQTGLLVNSAHLEHLYQEITIDTVRLGVIWIYCEAPDYHLVGDSDEGFTCVDDVARALVFYSRQYAAAPTPEVLDRVRAMTEFLLFMHSDNGYFYNFLLPENTINTTHQNSRAEPGWWSWRAFWALSEVNLLPSDKLTDLQQRIKPIQEELLRKMQLLCTPGQDTVVFDGVAVPACLAGLGADQVGVMMQGLVNDYQLHPSEDTKQLLLFLGNLLLQVQHGDDQTWPYSAIMSWRNEWHAWGNSQAYALLKAGRVLQNEDFIRAGINEVRNFYPYCMNEGFISGFKVVKDSTGLVPADFRQFPQIAYNARPMVLASLEAFRITGDTTYAATAGRLATWFFGNNPTRRPMYDPVTGRTFDGIGSADQVNTNSGAESTIEALLSLQAVSAVPEARQVLDTFIQNNPIH